LRGQLELFSLGSFIECLADRSTVIRHHAPAPGHAPARSAESQCRIVVDRGRYRDELVVEVERPDAVSPDAAALRRTRLERRFKEVPMVRTVVRVIEPSIYDVQVFKARRLTDRPSP
jgi:phenylacetate-coenzyme A ligase PaaK-like adenylate-forming protein